MQSLIVEIETSYRPLIVDLFETTHFDMAQGVANKIPGPAEISLQSSMERKSIGGPEILTAVISFSGGVSASLLASWLYEKLKNHNARLKINRIEIDIEEGEISKIIAESIEKS